MTLSIFSCASRPFVHRLWGNVYSSQVLCPSLTTTPLGGCFVVVDLHKFCVCFGQEPLVTAPPPRRRAGAQGVRRHCGRPGGHACPRQAGTQHAATPRAEAAGNVLQSRAGKVENRSGGSTGRLPAPLTPCSDRSCQLRTDAWSVKGTLSQEKGESSFKAGCGCGCRFPP